MFEVFFDCETKKFFDEVDGWDAAKLGVSVVSVYSRTVDEKFNEVSGRMESYWEAGFPTMWEVFAKADRIIGFNTISFDIPALSPYAPISFSKLPHFDILARIKEVEGKRVSLDSIARGTLGTHKSDTGENAIKYWNAGDHESLSKLKEYCEDDVVLTRDIYDHAFKTGFLKYVDFWNEIHEVKLDFSYLKRNDTSVQNSLF